MAVSESLKFFYDGVDFYEKYNLLNIHIDSGMFQETFLASRNIKEQKIRGNNKPYFQEIEDGVLSLKLTIGFENGFDEDKLRSLARDLKKDFYRKLIFSENPERVFFAILVDEPTLVHTGNNVGYISCSFRCDSPYTYSNTYTSKLYDLSSNTSQGTEIIFTNNGDLPCDAIIQVQVIDNNSFSIVNKSDSGKTISFSSLSDNEIITIDTENEEVETSLPDLHRFSNMTGDFYDFPIGINRLQIFGNIILQFKYEFKRLF